MEILSGFWLGARLARPNRIPAAGHASPSTNMPAPDSVLGQDGALVNAATARSRKGPVNANAPPADPRSSPRR